MKNFGRYVRVAQNIQTNFGIKEAAEYLKLHGFSVEAAMFVLLGK